VTVTALLAALASGALYLLSTNFGPVWLLAWIAPVPVLVYALGPARSRSVLAVAFGAWLLGELNVLPAYGALIPAPGLAILLALPSAVFAAIVSMTGRLARRLPPAAAVLVFPALWTSWEYVFSSISADGTALSVAYSQVRALPVIQIASVLGLAGITFVLCLVPSGLALAWQDRARWRSYLSVPTVALSLTLVFGVIALERPSDERPIRVGLAASDINHAWFDTRDPLIARRQAVAYLPRIEALANAGATLIVLPEMLTTLRPEWAADVRGLLADAARARHVMVVAGFNEWAADGRHRNVADVFLPDGTLGPEYVKERFLPGQDDFERGRDLAIVAGPDGRLGIAICKDMDFPIEARRYAAASVGLLLVPGWDFGRDGLFHAQMAWLRGVEGGFAIARSAADGLMTITDQRGRVLTSATSAAPEASLIATVVPGTGRTLYSRVGNVFGLACLVVAAALTLGAQVTHRSHRRLVS
jgi:apolipoprotein N-acyltransferase